MKLFLEKFIIITLFSSLLLLQEGCLEDKAKLEEIILKHDPSFKSVINKREALYKKLVLQEKNYLDKKKKIDGEIVVLKNNSQTVRRDYLASIEKIKHQVDPEKRQLNRNLQETERLYRLEGISLRGVNKDIKEINALIEKKDSLSLSQEEMQTWNQRLTALVEDKEKIVEKVEDYKKEIYITKLKLKVIDID